MRACILLILFTATRMPHRTFSLVAAAAIVGIAAIVFLNTNQQVPKQWQTFTSELGVELQYPVSWIMEDRGQNGFALMAAQVQGVQNRGDGYGGTAYDVQFTPQDPKDLPFTAGAFGDALRQAALDDSIRSLRFHTDTHASFVEHNDLTDTDMVRHYVLLPSGKILTTYYFDGAAHSSTIQRILESVTTQ